MGSVPDRYCNDDILCVDGVRKLLTITGTFNDFFTNYKDKESSISFEVDDEEDCTCGDEENNRCIIHQAPSNYVLSDINPTNQ